MTQSVETEVAGQISQHALLETFVPNLRKPKRKVAMDSTFPEPMRKVAMVKCATCNLFRYGVAREVA